MASINIISDTNSWGSIIHVSIHNRRIVYQRWVILIVIIIIVNISFTLFSRNDHTILSWRLLSRIILLNLWRINNSIVVILTIFSKIYLVFRLIALVLRSSYIVTRWLEIVTHLWFFEFKLFTVLIVLALIIVHRFIFVSHVTLGKLF